MDENTLNRAEIERLSQLENVVESGLTVFSGVIEALAEIWRSKLYREAGTFDEYCRSRWNFTANYAYRLFKALEVWTNLEGVEAAPLRETQVRPLVGLSEEKQRALWQDAVARYGPDVEQAQIQSLVDEDWVMSHAPFDVKEAVANNTMTVRQAIKLTQVLPRVNPAVAECVLMWGFGEDRVVLADAVIALDDLYKQNSDAFAGVALSGHIQTTGDPIPLHSANRNDILDLLDHSRFEHKMQQIEMGKATRNADLANVLLSGGVSPYTVINGLEDVARVPVGDMIAWVWATGEDDLLAGLVRQGFRVVAAMVVRGDPVVSFDGKPALTSALNGRRPQWFDRAVQDSVLTA